jgi:hypothetical protein
MVMNIIKEPAAYNFRAETMKLLNLILIYFFRTKKIKLRSSLLI